VVNSPDFNMIEPAWFYLKREITKLGAPKSRSEAERIWAKAWEDLDQWRIQAWIEHIPYHIQQVIALEVVMNTKKAGQKPRIEYR
jgi:hypothetical protein